MHGRVSTFLALLILSFAATFARADDVLLLVEDVPQCGLVAVPVDLAAAAARCGIKKVVPQFVAACSLPDGKPLPAQFAPDAEFDGHAKAAGTLLLRLPPDRPARVRLTIYGSPTAESKPWDGAVSTGSFTAVHDAKKQGGLPCRFTFAKTNKTFNTFIWNDRLYKPEIGGFQLRDDSGAKVELVSRGSLATVVRVSARYMQGAKAPDSAPRAVYHWCYFHDSPLVWVTAQISQDRPFDWRELHFLELNFRDKSFPGWAGGEPDKRGQFADATKSFHFNRYGALVDGPNAIGMFRCGRPIVYDGPKGADKYLQARGGAAWQGWGDTRAERSAWLWIDSREDPAKAISAAAEGLPNEAAALVTTDEVRAAIESAAARTAKLAGIQRQTAMLGVAGAEQFESQGRYQQALDALAGKMPSGWTITGAGRLGMIVERTGGGVRLVQLLDTATGTRLVAPEAAPLFSLLLKNAKSEKEARLEADAGWGSTEVKPTGEGGLELRWRGVPQASHRVALASRQCSLETAVAPKRAGETTVAPKRTGETPVPPGLEVVARATPDPKAGAIRWTINVANESPDWIVRRVVFPQLSLAEPGREGRVFVPLAAGRVWNEAFKRADRFQGPYPSGWTTMQYMAVYGVDGTTGLYVAVHDPLGSTKDLLAQSRPAEKNVLFAFDHPAENMDRPGNDFALSGEAVWQVLPGDWFDAAVIYRDWVRRHAQWYPKLTAEGREDTPKWMRELPAWALGGGAPGACVEDVLKFREYLGVPIGFHWYSWHGIPFDNDYPHYFPTKKGFSEAVARLQSAGVYVMPYINGRLWDTRDRKMEDFEFTRLALPAATKDEEGKPRLESYSSKEQDGSKVELAAMCPTTRLWRETVHRIVLRLMNECGVKGVYIDQIAAAKAVLCFDRSHGHPTGGGHWWTVDGYWPLLDALRRDMPQGHMITTECNAEPYIKWFDGYLTWHWQHDGQVPAFPAVYGGSIQMFGRAYRGGPTKDLALHMKAGQQLVYGEQIGWLGPGVVREKQNAAFLRQVVRLRWRFRRYFHAGQMERPPRLEGQIPRVTADWQWSGEWPVTTDAVLTGAWRLPAENRLLLLFVNVSDRPVTAKVEIDAKLYGLPGERVRVVKWTESGEGEKSDAPAAFNRDPTFPPRAAWAWELTPAAK